MGGVIMGGGGKGVGSSRMTPQCSFTGGHPLSDYESEASDLLNPKLFSSFWIWSDRPLCSTFRLILLIDLVNHCVQLKRRARPIPTMI